MASFYEQEGNLQLLCNFLRTKEGPAVREALLMDKRVLYMKGKRKEGLRKGQYSNFLMSLYSQPVFLKWFYFV